MRQFLIRYRFQGASEAAWQGEIARFIAALDADADLKGRISYRCMKSGADYFHLATAVDEAAVAALQGKDFFKRYTEQTRLAGGGQVAASPIEMVAQTANAGPMISA